MKPNNSNVATVEGDLQGLDIQMGIDPNSFAHIMSVLTDLYSDPALAVIREYSTNARDAMIEAGRGDSPIEVSLPNGMLPYFKVRDEGVGLDVSDIDRIYSKYGASTKRDSDEVVGMLGLGCKSALTYTSQFTVTSVKSGQKVVVSISRTEEHGGVMQIVDSRATDDDNWTEVSVPARNTYDFKEKAAGFFQYWPKGTVLVDGVEPDRHDGEEIAPGIFLRKGISASCLVMGNVPYPISSSHITGLPRNSALVIFAEMGEVNFTPSREALHYTTLTKNTLKKYNDAFTLAIDAKIRDAIASQPNHYAAILEFRKWRALMANGIQIKDYSYKGQTLPSDPEFWLDEKNHARGRVKGGRYKIGGSSYIHDTLYLETLLPYIDYSGKMHKPPLVVLNYPNVERCNTQQREKLDAYWHEQKLQDKTQGFVLLSESAVPGSPWTDAMITADWNDIKKIQLNTRGPSYTMDGKYDIYENNGKGWQGAGQWIQRHLDPKEEIIYWSQAEFDGYKISGEALTNLFPTATLVKTSKNRWEKLKRLYPKNRHIHAVLKEAVAEIAKNASPAAKIYAVIDEFISLPWISCNPEDFDDPEIATFVKALKDGKAEFVAMERKRKAIGNVLPYSTSSIAFNFPSVNNPFNKYVLINSRFRKESIEYINLVYAKRKEQNEV